MNDFNNYNNLNHYKGKIWVSKRFEKENRGNICLLQNGKFRVLAYISPDKLVNKNLDTIVTEVVTSYGTPYMLED